MDDYFDICSLVATLNKVVPEETDFFWWEYDDGSIASIAIDQKKREVLHTKCFDDKNKRKEFQNKVKAAAIKQGYEFEKFRLEITSGLKQFERLSDQFRSQIRPAVCYRELRKMLSSCGSDQQALQSTVTLFSAMLAGYYSRFSIAETAIMSERVDFHAPILTVSRQDGTYDVLRRIARSVIINSSPECSEEDELFIVTPPVIPTSLNDKHLDDSAACYLSRSKKNCYDDAPLPVQYRDTAVLINAAFCPSRELVHFQRRNPWVTTVLFGVQNRSLLIDPIRLDGKIFARCGTEWDTESIHELMLRFVARLAYNLRKKNAAGFRKRHEKIVELINQNNRKHGTKKYRGTMKFWLSLQMLALWDLAQFLCDNKAIDKEACNDLLSEWLNCLLPGCVPLPEDKRPVTERPVLVMERDNRELVELALRSLLTRENLQYYVYVPNRGKFPATALGHEVWGYLRDCRNNKNRMKFRALILPEYQFCELANAQTEVNCDWIAAVRAFKKKPPHYLHPTPAMRLSSERLEPVLILKLDELQFLDEGIRASLESLF